MKLKNITASYKDKIIYENVSVDFNRVGMTFIKGDSGSGKTTLLNMLYGLKSFEGEYIVEGEVTEFIRNNMAYIFQDFKVDTNLTVYENIVLQLNIKGIEIDIDYIDDLLDEFDMLGNKYKKTKVLSGGEKQRLAIVRALVTKPSVLLCDEPTGNLDEDKSIEIFDLLKEISKEKLVLVVSHNEMLIERYADVVYEIKDKGLVITKDSKLKEITFTDIKYGSISNKNLIRKSIFNFKTNLLKKLSIFLVFSLLASLFMILNFSKNANTNYITEKYSEFEGKDTIYVRFKNLKSLEYFDDFASEFKFDGFRIDSSTIDLVGEHTTYIHNDTFPGMAYITLKPPFLDESIISKYRKILTKKTSQKCSEVPILCSNYIVKELSASAYPLIVVSDFENLESSLILGRLPLNSEEVLINENMLIRIIDRYNNLILDNELDEDLLEYDTMNLDEINEFLNSNNLLLEWFISGSEHWEGIYTHESFYGSSYDVVGVVDDTFYRFDSTVYQSMRANFKNSFPTNFVYTSQELYLNETKKGVKYFIDRQVQKQDQFVPNSVDVQDIYNDNSLDLHSLDLFLIATMYRENMDIYEHIDMISKLEEHPDVKEVLISYIYESYQLDLLNIERINSQIQVYSIFILSIAFFTAFAPYYLMIRNRRKEFFMYRILRLEDGKRLKLYLFELLLIILVVSLMIALSYLGFSILLEEQLCSVFSALIYSSRLESLNLIISIKEVVILMLLFIPFVLSYYFLRQKKG